MMSLIRLAHDHRAIAGGARLFACCQALDRKAA